MKLVISRSLIIANNEAANEIAMAIAGNRLLEGQITDTLPTFTGTNVSLTRATDPTGEVHYTLEVNDRILTRILALYVRVARFAAPLITMCKAFAGTLDEEISAISEDFADGLDVELAEEEVL
jgi:hypothetical protein